MKWITRERVKVDRVACPWLIKRFVDPQAEFLFVPADRVAAIAEREGAIPYDVSGAELGHHGAECSFDAMVHKYNVTDPAVLELAKIARGADTADKVLTPYSRGLEAIAEGFRALCQDDHEINAREWIVSDALYKFCKKQVGAASP